MRYVTYDELFEFVSMLCAVISVMLLIFKAKKVTTPLQRISGYLIATN